MPDEDGERSFSVHQPHKGSIVVNLTPGREEWTFLLRSDCHVDSVHCDLEMEARHLEEAKARGAGIIDAGDTFDLMEGKYDPRGTRDSQHEWLRVGDYLDATIRWYSERVKPYANLFAAFCPGNHERTVLDRHDTDMTERLTQAVNDRGGQAVKGSYKGFISFVCPPEHLQFNNQNAIRPFRLWYHHGWGGGGPVTRGTIQANRIAVFVRDVDLCWTGHTHDGWRMTYSTEGINSAHRPIIGTCEHFRTPGYKDETRDPDSWASRKGHPPKPLGQMWLTLKAIRPNQRVGSFALIGKLEEAR